MYYDCLDTLPDNVRAALDEDGQREWMNAFNSTVKKSKSKKVYREAVFDAWKMVKGRPDCRFFEGFVSTEDLDRQNDVVLVDKAFHKIAKHVDRGGTMVDTHTNRTVGSFIYVEKAKNVTGKDGVKAYAVVYKGEPYYDTVWEQIKRGQDCPTCRDVRKGFSIGGFALDTRNTCDASGCHRDILDMSIHEISICHEPANPEARIQDVNMMAKSEEEVCKQENEISKDLRMDQPAEPEVPLQATAPLGGPQPPAEIPLTDQIKSLNDKAKEYEKGLKEMVKLKETIDKLMASLGNPQPVQSAPDVAKAQSDCGCFDHDVHTSITEDKCPMPKELYGDANDAQIKGTMEYLENKEIEADESAKKNDKTELMPGKFSDKLPDEKKGPDGPSVETKVMEGFKKLEPKNASESKTGGHLSSKEFESKCGPKDSKKTVNDKGDDREKNFKKETGDMVQKDCGDPNCPNQKVEIPAELMPMFQEFLQEKGIKMEPDVENPEIEEPMEKTLYVDSDISEMDMKELAEGVNFDSSEALGKSATMKLRVHNADTKMRLAKNLKVVDIEYLIKAGEDPNLPSPPEDQFPYRNKNVKVKMVGGVAKPKGKVTRGQADRIYHSVIEGAEEDAARAAGKNREVVGEHVGLPEVNEDELVSGNKCPRCGSENVYENIKGSGCHDCGWHNVPHAGTPGLTGVRKAGEDPELPLPPPPKMKRKNRFSAGGDKYIPQRVNVKTVNGVAKPSGIVGRGLAEEVESEAYEAEIQLPARSTDMEPNYRKIAPEEVEVGLCPHCGNNQLYTSPNGDVGCLYCGYSDRSHAGTPKLNKAGEDPNLPNAPPSVPNRKALKPGLANGPVSDVESAYRDYKARHAGDIRRFGEKDIQSEFNSEHKGVCPQCGQHNLAISDQGKGCEFCGYHDIPHAGTPAAPKKILTSEDLKFDFRPKKGRKDMTKAKQFFCPGCKKEVNIKEKGATSDDAGCWHGKCHPINKK